MCNCALVFCTLLVLTFILHSIWTSLTYRVKILDSLLSQLLVSSTDGVGTATQSIMRMVVRPPMMRSDAIRPDLTEQGERFNYLT